MRHPRKNKLAQETGSSSAGATVAGELVFDANNFLRLGRRIRDDLLNCRLTFIEFSLLVWLWLEANPHNGRVKISYEGLRQDLRGEYSKNKINKIVLSLKLKGYLGFERQQGRRGSFLATLDNYPLSNRRFTNIKGTTISVIADFQPNLKRTAERRTQAEVPTEVVGSEQKFNESFKLQMTTILRIL